MLVFLFLRKNERVQKLILEGLSLKLDLRVSVQNFRLRKVCATSTIIYHKEFKISHHKPSSLKILFSHLSSYTLHGTHTFYPPSPSKLRVSHLSHKIALLKNHCP